LRRFYEELEFQAQLLLTQLSTVVQADELFIDLDALINATLSFV